MTISQDNACIRLSALGFKQHEVHPIVDLVNKWSLASGPEWTVSRLKSIKQLWLHRLAGEEGSVDWISTRGGIPKGPFRILFKQLSSHRRKVRALNALMVYSELVGKTVTPAQWAKFSNSVEKPPKGDTLDIEKISKRVSEIAVKDFADLKANRKSIRSADSIPWEARGRRCPMGRDKETRTVPEGDVKGWFDSRMADEFTTNWQFKFPILNRALPLGGMQGIAGFPIRNPGTVGRIAFIQEPGFKLRAIANPCRFVQLALEPLQKGLWDILAKLREDCTFDQESGVTTAQEWLREGKTVFAVDLSDATNVFPLNVQLRMLRAMAARSKQGDDEYLTQAIGLFEIASKGRWVVKDPSTGEDRTIKWSKGQPLGLTPSFGAFALAHHCVARLAQAECGGYGSYRILGDDIVMTDERLHSQYRSILESLGCPVSQSKCFTSSRLTEFAGKIITPTEVLTGYKWKKSGDRNFIDLLRSLGTPAFRLLRPRQKRVAKLICSIPEWLGGLGFNPEGLTLAKRTELAEKLGMGLWKEPHSTRFVRSVCAQNRNLMKSGMGMNHPFPYEVGSGVGPHRPDGVSDLRSVILNTCGVIAESFTEDESPGKGWVSLDIPTGDPRGRTLLQLYERKIATMEARNKAMVDELTSSPSPNGDHTKDAAKPPKHRWDIGM